MVNVHDDPIELVPADYETWRERFRAERDRVHDALAAADLEDALVRLEHVGSTSVPGLAAKDIVDLNVVVVDDDVVDAVSTCLVEELGGDRAENNEEWHPVFRETNGQRFNVHVFAASSDGWKVSVATRKVLRANESLREEYEALKRDLAGDTHDLTDYSRGKSAFIGRVLDRARTDDAVALDFAVPEKG